MKVINLLKSLPVISTLIFIVFISFNNQKQTTKLRLLIWDTPSLSLGTYLAISTGTGFILSYILTTKFINSHKTKVKNEIYEQLDNLNYPTNNSSVNIKNNQYGNILIERDIKDPSPTINANFRVIGNTNKDNESTQQFYSEENDNHDFQEEFDSPYNEDEYISENDDKKNLIMDDWLDDTYLNW